MQVLTTEYVNHAIANMDYVFDCMDTHPGCTCNQKTLQLFLRAFIPVLKTYIPVHVVPFLLFKRKKFLKDPIGELIKLFVGIMRSVLFGAGYYCSFKRFSCLLFGHTTYKNIEIPISTALGGMPLLFESKGRQAQIALFGVYKNFQTLYKMGMRRKLPIKIPYGNCVITGIALCIICFHYFNNKESIKQSYVDLIDKLLEKC